MSIRRMKRVGAAGRFIIRRRIRLENRMTGNGSKVWMPW